MPHLNHEPPKDYCCPITTELMADPVMAADGHSYERSAIMEWLATNNTSPLTREVLEHKQVIANRTLKKAIQTFIDANKSVYQMQFIKAMQQGDYDTIGYLEKLGVNLKITDSRGWSLSHYAVNRGSLAEIKALSEKGLLSNDNTATATIQFYLPECVHTIQEAEATLTALEHRKNLLTNNRYYYYEDKDKQPIADEATLKKEIAEKDKRISQLNYQDKALINNNGYVYGNGGKYISADERQQELLEERRLIERAKNPMAMTYHKLVTAREKAEAELKDIEWRISGSKNSIEYQKKRLADFCHQTYSKLTPLHLAINNHAVPIVQFFLDQGFSLEDKDMQGATLIFWSIYKNNVELFNLFIEKGANLEAIDNEGNSLLHAAAQYADKTLVESLLSRGFNHQVKNNAGQTPADIARKHQKTAIADYITQQGEQLWQNMPKRLVAQEQRILAQDQRIDTLVQQVKLLQEQLASLLNHGPQKAARDSVVMAVQSSSSASKLGLFNHRQNYILNKVTADESASNTLDDATSKLNKFN